MWHNKIVGHADIDPESLLAHPGNFRIHPSNQQKALEGSIGKLGFIRSVTVSQRTGTVIDGHLRVILALRNQEPTIPVEYVDLTEQEENEALLLLDPISAMAATDKDKMEELFALVMGDDDMDEMMMAISENEQVMQAPEAPADPLYKTLAERFGVPPFSVLDARQGYWQERKRAWISLGIRGELGRGGNLQGISAEAEDYRNGEGDCAKGKQFSGAMNDSKEFPDILNRQASYKGKGNLTYATGAPRKDEVSAKILGAGRKSGITFGSGAPGDLAASMKKTNRLAPGGTGTNSEPSGVRTPEVEARYAKGQHNFVNGVLMKSDSGNDPAYYFKKQAKEKELGHTLTTEEFQENYYEGPDSYTSGTSIFDPVLCELAYRWFCKTGGTVLDPFAGGSVRGIVASKLGYKYIGIDLRSEQIEANELQANLMQLDPAPIWLVGDSRNVDSAVTEKVDFVFSCPPYFDLELYSENDKDLSNTGDYETFKQLYREIISKSVALLNDDRFAVFVVGDIRDKNGFYRNFVSDTIQAFEDAGAKLYNEAILVTAVGSLPIRVGRQFSSGRKLGKTHQNVLVFYKGNPQAVKSWGEPEFGFIEIDNGEDLIVSGL